MTRTRVFFASALFGALALLWARAEDPAPGGDGEAVQDTNADSTGCVSCHSGIEEMHPWFPISCVGCHGGNGTAKSLKDGHVRPKDTVPSDERVLARDFDPEYLRFQNPTNMRVVEKTCGECHTTETKNLFKSLHGTTAGHLCDGLYENGVVKNKCPQYSVMDVKDDDGDVPAHAIASLTRIPAFESFGTSEKLAAHYRDVPRKSCMQCHLWNRGRAVRGRLGMDGDYRSEGCAACHVTYADDGLTETADATVPKFEPGHPLKHRLTSSIPTTTCVHCHYGDASIGLSFRGMAQMAPGMPGGPQVPGTTPMRLNGAWYIRDDKVTPPDVHHASGMHCIDCHTAKDTMGDGNIYGQMEHAVEMECSTCHGTFEKYADFKTEKGFELEHVKWNEGGKAILTSKVDGKEHPVVQVKDVITVGSEHFNERGAKAMTPAHAKMECYTCHNGWTPNFFGFHFDRNESFSQLDVLAGTRTAGRVTTLEKVFTTFRHFQLGVNSEGRVSPYMVGFSTMGTVRDEKGKYILDQQMPVTAAGLSGMTMIHHQTHTTRPEARACAECHRSGATWGLGSENHKLMRDFFFSTSAAGLEVFAFDRKNPDRTRPAAVVPIKDARGVALVTDPLQGHAEWAFVSGVDGVTVVKAGNPAFPKAVARIDCADPRMVRVAGKRLYVCDGKNGLRIYDISKPEKPVELGRVQTTDAHDVALNGPYAFVADGEGGLVAIDVGDAAKPVVLGRASMGRGGETSAAGMTKRVIVNFQYSRPNPGNKKLPRTKARLIAYVADDKYGLRIFDATEPSKMTLIRGFENMLQGYREAYVRAIAFSSQYDLGSEGGQIPSEENDYVYGTLDTIRDDGNRQGYFFAIRVTDPDKPQQVGFIQAQDRNDALAVIHAYNPPFLQHFAALATGDGMYLIDVSKPATPAIVAAIAGPRGGGAIALEAFPLDRMIDEEGKWLKDISHEGARHATKDEVLRILRTPIK